MADTTPTSSAATASESFPSCVPELADGTVTLRAHRRSDRDAIVEQARDPLSVRFTTVPAPYEPIHAEQFLAQIEQGWNDPVGNRYWAIEALDGTGDAAMPRFAGTIDYRPSPAGIAEVGFGLHPWARGRGLTTRALRLVCAQAFDHAGVEAMRWRAQVPNWASRRTAWACGFRMDGEVRQLLPGRDGERYDGWVATLLKGEPMVPTHPWHVPPVLDGGRVRLRPWRDHDRPLEGQGPDAASLRYLPKGRHPAPADFDAWLSERCGRMALGASVVWCVADALDDQPMGMLSVFDLDDPLTRGSGEVGYWLQATARGRSVMAEAMELLLPYAFAPAEQGGLALHRVSAGTDAANAASARVLERAGFSRVGVERSVMWHDDEPPTDGVLWELLSTEASR